MQTQLEFDGWATKAVATSHNRKPKIVSATPGSPTFRSTRPGRWLPPSSAGDWRDTGATDPLDAEILAGCLRRIRSWRVPPNWSARDWFGEMQSNSAAALWQAKCEYDPTRGVPLGAFERLRVIASAWTRYRQEWSYASHCPPQEDRIVPETATRDGSSLAPMVDPVRDALAQIPEADRWLLEQLFWAESSETSVAQKLGVSQQAVSKRRGAVLRRLRDLLGEARRAGPGSGASAAGKVLLAQLVVWGWREMCGPWL